MPLPKSRADVSHGAIVIDKPQGYTSAQIVSRIKKQFSLHRVGHAGTLDPAATGVLIVLCGKATKLQDFLLVGAKEYSGEIILGVRTDTDDLAGTVLEERQYHLPEGAQFDELRRNIEQHFSGLQLQLPPIYSAKRVDGERSYEAARRGVELRRTAQEVQVEIVALERAAPNRLRYHFRVSKGTYVRSLARDIGDYIGCGGCAGTIRRVASRPFEIAQARALTDVELVTDIADILVPVEDLVGNLPRFNLSWAEYELLKVGNQRPLERLDCDSGGEMRAALYTEEGVLRGLLDRASDRWRLHFMF